MKRILLILSLVTLFVAANGQEIVRSGNHYLVGDENYATSTAFRGYLQNTNHELFASYNQAYKLGMSGWGLLAFGTATGATSALWIFTQLGGIMAPVQAAIGGAAMIAGTTMLCVGYQRMHKVVDDYSVQKTSGISAYWTINMKPDGIGLAYHF